MTRPALARRRAARLRHARRDARSSRPRSTRRGSSACASAMADARLRPARRLRRSRAQREPVVPDRLRPALRGGAPHRRARTASRPILVGNECWGMAGAAPLPMRRHLFQDLSLPSQPRDRSRPLARDPRRRGDRAGRAGRRRRLEDVRATGRRCDAPAYLVDELRGLAGPAGCVENATDLLIDAGRRPAGHQRGRAARRPRVAPRARRPSGVRNLLVGPAPGHDRARGGRACSAGTARRCRAT